MKDRELKNECIIVCATKDNAKFEIRDPLRVSEKKMSSGDLIGLLQTRTNALKIIAIKYARLDPKTKAIVKETPWFLNPVMRKEGLMTLPSEVDPMLMILSLPDMVERNVIAYQNAIAAGATKTEAMNACIKQT